MSNHQRGIQTVEFAGEILKLICSSSKSLSLSEISESLQLPPGSAYKYLVSLLHTGLLKRDPTTLEFEAGPLSLRMGLAKINHDVILTQARQALTVLAEKYQLNVFASMWSKSNGPTVVFYKETGGFFHIGFRLGIRLSLHRTASGRIFSAYMDEQSLKEYDHGLTEEHVQSLSQPDFIDAIRTIKQQGYSYLKGKPTPGMTTYAVPVFDSQGQFIMAMTAFHTSEHMATIQAEELIQDLKNIAENLAGYK